MTHVEFISGPDVALLLKDGSKTLGIDFAIVDVRDDDFQGGHIKGAIHSPSSTFLTTIPSLLAKLKDGKLLPVVIFHCALSQQRGPKAARRYIECRALHGYSTAVVPKQNGTSDTNTITTFQQKVYVLQDGFVGFQRLYRGDVQLIKDWEDVWDEF